MVKLFKILGTCILVASLVGCAKPQLPPPPPALVTSALEDITGARTSVTRADTRLVRGQDLARQANEQGVQPKSPESEEMVTLLIHAREDLQAATISLAQAEARTKEVDRERQRFFESWQSAHEALGKEKEKSITEQTLKNQAIRQRNILAVILGAIVLGFGVLVYLRR